jgi:hypothetical protein
MKSFKEFTEKRKCITIICDDTSNIKLRKWCTDNGFDLTVDFSGKKQSIEDFDFHTTITYSETAVNLSNYKGPMKTETAEITGIKFLGNDLDVPVLSIKSDGIMAIKKKYTDLGLIDKWPDYIPHISLSYAKEARDIRDIVLPDFDVTYNTMKIKDID